MQIRDTAFFLELETRVWQALVEGDRDADELLLDPDFLGVYAQGVCGRTEHADQLKAGPSVATFSLANARILALSADIVVLNYLARWQRHASGQAAAPETMLVSSIWQHKDGAWLNVFSQDTPSV